MMHLFRMVIGGILAGSRARKVSPRTRSETFRIEALEPRLLLDADPLTQAVPSVLLPEQIQPNSALVLDIDPVDWAYEKSSVAQGAELEDHQLQPLIDEALLQLQESGIDPDRLKAAKDVKIKLVDLAAWEIAETTDDQIS